MSREIEFRGKSLKSNHWVYGSYTKEKLEVISFKYINDGVTHWRIDPDTLGQYICTIGEQKIYEGDILVFNNHQDLPYKVDFDKEKLAYCLYSTIFGGSWGELSRAIEIQGEHGGLSCIGNIHDNPELIEVTNE